MRRTFPSLILLLLLATALASGQVSKPEPAQSILGAAIQQAGTSGRNVLVIFHASWCGWCKRLDAVLENPAIKNIIEASYVVVRLDVMESANKKDLENPGGQQIINNLGGAKSGLPFYAFYDGSGQRLANSNVMPDNQNIGYPGSPEEIVAFEKLLQQTATRMTEEQHGQIVAYLKQHAPR